MEIKNDEFRTLRSRVDHISSELDKQNTVRAVNTKWMLTVGAAILVALGYTSFVQLPREAAKAAREQVGPEIIEEATQILSDLNKTRTHAKDIEMELGEILEFQRIVNLPIGTIVASMLEPSEFAGEVADPDPSKFDPEESKWVLADGEIDITNSRYWQLSKKTTPPDLRGMFLRGMNVEGKGVDPDKNREVGKPQKDALQQHGHETNARALGQYVDKDTTELGYTSHGGADYAIAEVRTVKETMAGEKVNVAGETRPKNVAVYFYIKIN